MSEQYFFSLDHASSASKAEIVLAYLGGRNDNERTVRTVDETGAARDFLIRAIRSTWWLVQLDSEGGEASLFDEQGLIRSENIPERLEFSGEVNGVYARLGFNETEDEETPEQFWLNILPE